MFQQKFGELGFRESGRCSYAKVALISSQSIKLKFVQIDFAEVRVGSVGIVFGFLPLSLGPSRLDHTLMIVAYINVSSVRIEMQFQLAMCNYFLYTFAVGGVPGGATTPHTILQEAAHLVRSTTGILFTCTEPVSVITSLHLENFDSTPLRNKGYVSVYLFDIG